MNITMQASKYILSNGQYKLSSEMKKKTITPRYYASLTSDYNADIWRGKGQRVTSHNEPTRYGRRTTCLSFASKSEKTVFYFSFA